MLRLVLKMCHFGNIFRSCRNLRILWSTILELLVYRTNKLLICFHHAVLDIFI